MASEEEGQPRKAVRRLLSEAAVRVCSSAVSPQPLRLAPALYPHDRMAGPLAQALSIGFLYTPSC